MASNYPDYTASGRRVKPTEKVRLNLQYAAEKKYDDAVNQVKSSTKKLRQLVRSDPESPYLGTCYDAWLADCDSLFGAEQRLTPFVDPSEEEEHTQRFIHYVQYLRDLKEEVRVHYKPTPRSSSIVPPAASGAKRKAGDIAKRYAEILQQSKELEEEIAKVERELSTIGNQESQDASRSRSSATNPPGARDLETWDEDKEDEQRSRSRVPEPRRRQALDKEPPQEPRRFVTSTPTQNLTDIAGADHRDSSVLGVINRLAEVLSDKREHLPRREPRVFKGEVTKYFSWLSSYDTLVENTVNSPAERLYYLGKYTEGKPHECIAQYLDHNTHESYVRAKLVLHSRYGDRNKVARSYKEKLKSWPVVKKNDGEALLALSDFLWQCHSAITDIGGLDHLNSEEEINKIVKKLPFNMSDRWARQVDRYMHNRSTRSQGLCVATRQYPPFEELCLYVSEEARIATGPCSDVNRSSDGQSDAGSGEAKRKNQKPYKQVHTLNTQTNASGSRPHGGKGNDKNPNAKCLFCKGVHHVSTCMKFLKQTRDAKREFVKNNGVCFGCLKRGHSVKDCHSKRPELMSDGTRTDYKVITHLASAGDESGDDQYETDSQSTDVNSELDTHEITSHRLMTGTGAAGLSAPILPVVIYHSENPDLKILTYVLLDTQSSGCLITNSLAERLNVDQKKVNLKLTTMSSSSMIPSTLVYGLKARGLSEITGIRLPKCFTQSEIPFDKSTIPHPRAVARWDHLAKVADHLHVPREDLEVGILLGYNCAAALQPQELISNTLYEPYAQRTSLGWSVVGNLDLASREADEDSDDDEEVICHHIGTRNITHVDITKLFEMDFPDTSTNKTTSREDQKFINILDAGVTRTDTKHVQLPLPFRKDKPDLPNNRCTALKRLTSVRKKLVTKPDFCRQYVARMKEVIDNGYAERIPDNELAGIAGQVWYLFHHGVMSEKKPGEVRIVYDGPGQHKGRSINAELLIGPDMMNNLVGVFCRFRQGIYAFTCDIKGMFYQVKVDPDHKDYLRFLWFEDNDPTKEVVEYRMLVHPFGIGSSPGCSNYALKTVAKAAEQEYGEEVTEFISKDFYVDDGLKSNDDKDLVKYLIKSSHEVCATGGFHLQKYICNDPEITLTIPKELRAKQPERSELDPNAGMLRSTLGSWWNHVKDQLEFKFEPHDKPKTRRGYLSSQGSVFDPLGLIGPALLEGKLILQSLCKDKFGWDDTIPQDMQERWQKWYESLAAINKLAIPRCYHSKDMGKIVQREIHYFSDASCLGYGFCAYMRTKDEDGKIESNLILSKARVVPKKPITIPRLELQAALMSAKSHEFLKEEITVDIDRYIFWCDSQVVLGYLANEAKRFHIFVQNRVCQINELTAGSEWRYIETHSNPADLASRGILAQKLVDEAQWWNGPRFLVDAWELPMIRVCTEVNDRDPEVKKIRVLTQQVKETQTGEQWINECLSKIGDWHRLLRTVSIWKRYFGKLRDFCVSKRTRTPTVFIPISTVELYKAEMSIISFIQKFEYPELFNKLMVEDDYPTTKHECKKRKGKLKTETNLYKLDPYLGSDGVIRVGGRIRRSNLPKRMVHPKILPRNNHVTQLILADCHNRTFHSGRSLTLTRLRENGYWLVGGISNVQSYIRKCVICQYLRAQPRSQKMGDLPSVRLEPAPPFTHTGVDIFGPFLIKSGRSQKKRWLCLFTCLVTRAIHIEVVHTMSTDSFINAYRRFVNRRGKIRTLHSDQGSNFVGAQSELQEACKEINFDKVSRTLLKDSCDLVDYNFNFPKSSHMGGVWERMIRCARGVLSRLLAQHSENLDDELLSTFVTEAEAVVNSRPLTFLDSVDPLSDDPITPAQLLTFKSQIVQPLPGKFQKEDVYCRRRWRRVQFLANQFWLKWRTEFVAKLQSRVKWNNVRDNLKVDDVVMMVDDQLPRCCWPRALVLKVYPDDKGRVRKVTVKTVKGTYDRPIHKLILLHREV